MGLSCWYLKKYFKAIITTTNNPNGERKNAEKRRKMQGEIDDN